ncbi:MAG: hypothetical protein HYY06_18880 [Deltaproteobacteria bacterium]|nr:hypothetical protein [Deltaproteobacteria bacterium]
MSSVPPSRPLAPRLLVVARDGGLLALASALAAKGYQVVVERTGLAGLRHLRKRGGARVLVLDSAATTDGMVEQVEEAALVVGR